MTKGTLEHVNLTVSDPDRLAALLCALTGWRERWRGPSQLGGNTIHIGDEQRYLALYCDDWPKDRARGFSKGAPLNHVGLVIDDLDAAKAIVREAGLQPFGHGDYEPGRRFYFFDWDGIEFEIVSYA